MASIVMVIGQSGTGKSTSLRNFNRAAPVKVPLSETSKRVSVR